MSVILGLNSVPLQGYDAAAALVVDGVVVAAVEEEELCHVKRTVGLPPVQSAHEVLNIAGLTTKDVDTVAVPWVPHAMGYEDSSVEENLRRWLTGIGFRGSELQIRFIEHHVAHAWSGLSFASDVLGRRFGVLVVDCLGEATGGAAYIYDRGLKCQWHLELSSSLGIYYEAVTNYLGFNWGAEGKTMLLASYGRSHGIEMPGIPDNRFLQTLPTWTKRDSSPKHVNEAIKRKLMSEISKLHGDKLTFNRRADIAMATQEIVAERIMTYVRELTKDVDGFVLAGEVALNCAINAQIAEYCRMKGLEFVVPPPANDTGVALGAAVAAFYELSDNLQLLKQPYLGAGFTTDEIVAKIGSLGLPIKRTSYAEIASGLFKDDLICGWFEGRCEIGLKSLGKRSIIARPDSAAVRDRINVLKMRDNWCPLSPSLSAVEFERYFPNSIPSRHMLINATNFEDSKQLHGVLHVDGTTQPQVVDEAGPYLSLLSEVGSISGCEAVICTSFNRTGEPIVYSPEDAVASACAMGLDALAGDGWIVKFN